MPYIEETIALIKGLDCKLFLTKLITVIWCTILDLFVENLDSVPDSLNYLIPFKFQNKRIK